MQGGDTNIVRGGGVEGYQNMFGGRREVSIQHMLQIDPGTFCNKSNQLQCNNTFTNYRYYCNKGSPARWDSWTGIINI